MTRMLIDLMPKPPKAATTERLRTAQIAVYKLLVWHLKKVNELNEKLIEMYQKYFDFMERRYPV